LFACFCLLFFRLAYIQILKHGELSYQAKEQHLKLTKVRMPRGTIFDRNGKEMAVSLAAKSVYGVPSEIKDPSEIAWKLSSVLSTEASELQNKFSAKNSFCWIERKIDLKKAKDVQDLNLKGIGLLNDSRRAYPQSSMACHVIGFVGVDDEGLEGVELNCDRKLRGRDGSEVLSMDAKGQLVISSVQKYTPPEGGLDVCLTIDQTIQYIAEEELESAWKKYHAKAGMVIVLRPETGEILAMANRPNFDLNNYRDYSAEERRNRTITDIFEPGSTFKIISGAAALESGVRESDKVFCENGCYQLEKRKIRDHEKHGWLTFRQVIAYSSNIGMAKISARIPREKIYDMARAFGFGNPTRIDLPGEGKGLLRHPHEWSEFSTASIAYGQEVGVTAIQLAAAFAAVANNGVLMKPYIVKCIKDKDEILEENKPEKIRQVIPQETARQLISLMEDVVSYGTATSVSIPGVKAAGKTGTAQKTDPVTHKYSADRYTASFIGMVPSTKPRLVILVIVDEPKGCQWGGVICGPVFSNIGKRVLHYLDYRMETGQLAQAGEK